MTTARAVEPAVRPTETTRPAAPAGSTPRLGPGAVLAMQRAAGNRATGRALARAIIAIDGKGESEKNPAGRATRACLWNLQHVKKWQEHVGGDARGKVEGPKEIDKIAPAADFLAGDSETIYVLAHGSRWSQSVAGVNAATLASWLRLWVGARPFKGKLKLVSCHSASEMGHRKPGDDPRMYNFSQSYAQALAIALAPLSDADTFRPTSVQGIAGIGWVDEWSGRLTAIDKNIYDTAVAHMGSNSDVGGLAPGKHENPFTELDDPVRRGYRLRAWFDTPREAKVPAAPAGTETTPGGDPRVSAMNVGKGWTGKRRFAVGSGAEIL